MKSESAPKNQLDELKEIIAGSASAIDREYARTANSWLACFGSRVFLVESLIHNKESKRALPSEKLQEARSQLENLKEKLATLKEQYPDKETVPPVEIKQDLLKELNILK